MWPAKRALLTGNLRNYIKLQTDIMFNNHRASLRIGRITRIREW